MSSLIKVLVVDDEEDLAEIISESLESHFDSSFVTSAEAALEYIEKEKVDVIISDSHMPGMTGLDLLAKISLNSNGVLFYLATGDVTISEAQIIEKGGHGVFEKPYSIGQAVEKIKKDFEAK